MSIQEFHSRLVQTDAANLHPAQQQSSLMSALRRLSLVENLRKIIEKPVFPLDWPVWTSGLAEQ
jgi:hypothetical protein